MTCLYADPKSRNDHKRIRTAIKGTSFTEKQRGTFLTVLFRAHTMPGSITIEAALVLPLFLMTIMAVYALFGIMGIQLRVQRAINETAEEIAHYYYAIDHYCENGESSGLTELVRQTGVDITGWIISETLVKSLVTDDLGDALSDGSVIKNGADGMSFFGSGYVDQTDEIRIRVSYTVVIPYLSDEITGLRLIQQCSRRAWIGRTNSGDSDEEIVFVTETGTVYHTSISCTHLKLSISEIDAAGVGSLRNSDGCSYSPCELCDDRPETGILYITTFGDCYHRDRNCSGLRRSIRSISRNEVGDRSECSRCKKRDAS